MAPEAVVAFGPVLLRASVPILPASKTAKARDAPSALPVGLVAPGAASTALASVLRSRRTAGSLAPFLAVAPAVATGPAAVVPAVGKANLAAEVGLAALAAVLPTAAATGCPGLAKVRPTVHENAAKNGLPAHLLDVLFPLAAIGLARQGARPVVVGLLARLDIRLAPSQTRSPPSPSAPLARRPPLSSRTRRSLSLRRRSRPPLALGPRPSRTWPSSRHCHSLRDWVAYPPGEPGARAAAPHTKSGPHKRKPRRKKCYDHR